MKNYIEQLQADLDHAAETGNDRVSTDFDTANNALGEIDRLRAENAELVERCVQIALNPGFIAARDNEWDEGVNYAREFIAKAIRSLAHRHYWREKTVLNTVRSQNGITGGLLVEDCRCGSVRTIEFQPGSAPVVRVTEPNETETEAHAKDKTTGNS